MDRIGPGGPQGIQPPLVDQERSGPPWTMLRHFPDAIGHPAKNITDLEKLLQSLRELAYE